MCIMVYKNLLLFFEIFKLFTQITSTTFKKGIIMKIQRNNFNYFWLLRERLTFWKQQKKPVGNNLWQISPWLLVSLHSITTLNRTNTLFRLVLGLLIFSISWLLSCYYYYQKMDDSNKQLFWRMYFGDFISHF